MKTRLNLIFLFAAQNTRKCIFIGLSYLPSVGLIDNFCLISIEKSCNYGVSLPVRAGLASALKTERGCPCVSLDIFSEVLLPH